MGESKPDDSTSTAGFDETQPLVAQVGRLGPHYWEWVNRPVPGQPRFFASPLLEGCSKTVWWAVPLIWTPVYLLVAAAALRAALTPAQLAVLQLSGVALWQLLEYGIHRGIFHAKLTSYWGITFHFLFHGCHHKYPSDGLRLVFPPVPAALIAAGIYAALRAAVGATAPALGIMSGVLLGYIAYDCLHYAMHHPGGMAARALLGGPLLKELRARHKHHHFCDHDSGYGISSTLVDCLFGTLADLSNRPGSKGRRDQQGHLQADIVKQVHSEGANAAVARQRAGARRRTALVHTY